MQIKPREIWEKGTPLNKAWEAFSDSKLRDEFSSLFAFEARPYDPQKGFGENVAAMLPGLFKTMTIPQRRKYITDEMRKSLVTRLSNETLAAYAFPIWPSEVRIPRRIQGHFWINATIDWEHESASDESSHFHKIRVVDPGQFPELDLKPAIGRKTNRETIETALIECLRNDSNFINLNNKTKTEEIRKRIEATHPTLNPYGPGFHDDTIRKLVNSYLKRNGLQK